MTQVLVPGQQRHSDHHNLSEMLNQLIMSWFHCATLHRPCRQSGPRENHTESDQLAVVHHCDIDEQIPVSILQLHSPIP
jgi:hypothetical protein